ncbi:MAG TPA: hypothetical protein VM911_15070 [Pyrinomonadaceae bacterium]|nr:hypothetical protein [Pyrinomonadaceae bacterium]
MKTKNLSAQTKDRGALQDFFERRSVFVALLLLLFLFRLGFGLCENFWGDDEKQIYLIGLKFFTTGHWPYFGPDVDVENLQRAGLPFVQIPGALQGLLVGLPFFVFPFAEAPILFLNLLSFLSLCLLAWYCTRRLPQMPRWFIWVWLMTAPWTLNFSTHVNNLSYVLVGSVLFFVGALETYPSLSKKLIPVRWANFMMGAALLWIMQLHLSWIILLPYIIASFYFQFREDGGKAFGRATLWFALGGMIVGSFLLPTYLKYGLTGGMGRTGSMVSFSADNLQSGLNPAEGILPRFLSFASFEMARFIGGHTVERLAFLRQHWWVIPFALFAGLVGILQPVGMLVLWFFQKRGQTDWRSIKYLTLLTVCLLYLSFMFSKKGPTSHTFYVLLPLAMIYGFYCWNNLLQKRRWQVFAAIFLACGMIFNVALALNHYRTHSLYVNRSLPQSAIDGRNYSILGERRSGAFY